MKLKMIKPKIEQKTIEAYTFVLPYIIGAFLFFLFPIGFSLAISLGEYKIVKGGNTLTFLGAENYVSAFRDDIEFTQVFYKTILDTLTNTPLIVVFSLIFAVVLNVGLKGRGIYRTIFFIPFLLGTGYVMKQLLGVGAVDNATTVARSILLPDELRLYIHPKIVEMISFILGKITWILWRSGVQIILFLAGLQSINTALYESAKVDGATAWETFWKITIPMISPITVLVVIYSIIDSFVDPTNPMIDLFMDRAFMKVQFSQSAAMSWIYFSFVLVLVSVVFAVMKKISTDVSDF